MGLEKCIIMLYCMFICIVDAEELIKQGDFQGYIMNRTNSFYNYTTKIYPDSTYSWYALPDKFTDVYQVRDIVIDGMIHQGLDPGFQTLTTVCQDVNMNPQK